MPKLVLPALEFAENSDERAKDHIVAFARSDGNTTIITIVPRFLTRLIQPGEYPLGKQWHDTCFHLPSQASSTWYDAITEQMIQVDGSVQVGEALKYFPVALLVG